MAARIDLKTCPICGNPMPRQYEWKTEGMATIECVTSYHLVRTLGRTLEEAAERWNRREEVE